MVSQRFDGSRTTVAGPGVTLGAASFSARSSGIMAISVSQSQPSPRRYSNPRAVGGARDRMVSITPV
ncbi:unannotated protein [freshwater metagenome]|uniref:Unannotated protein n=1 Tax=freshwater metagenome TaxID=449393 RepID=A0A6J6UUB3_9ZZZZ